MTAAAGGQRSALPGSVLVVGYGVTGAAVTDVLVANGTAVTVADDRATPELAATIAAAGATPWPEADGRPASVRDGWVGVVADHEAVVLSPGVPDVHPVIGAAATAGVPVLDEFDLAAALDDRPLVAITGTNGKTTVTAMVAAALRAGGQRVVEAGNTEVPLVAAIGDDSVDVFVVEASSFRLGHARHFTPRVATWLNFAPDHLDVHESLDAYRLAKARIWADQGPGDIAVANADDPVVAASVRSDDSAPQLVTFGLDGLVRPGHVTVAGNRIVGADGGVVADTDVLWRRFPHDLANAAATTATAMAAGASAEATGEALEGFTGLAHRVTEVARHRGVAWLDDSKATTPHATIAAVTGLDSVVLIAGGRNKGVDLGVWRHPDVLERLRAVVAIGEAASEVAGVFSGAVPVVAAGSMTEAVAVADSFAIDGDTVLLSPGCASFDWYGSYAERGDDFAARVAGHLGGGAA